MAIEGSKAGRWRHGGGRRASSLVLLVAAGVAACGTAPRSPSANATTSASPTASAAVAVPLEVRFAGAVNCAMFPYSCTATLSVLPPGAGVPDAWRPASSDPWWGARYDADTASGILDPETLGGTPATAPGRQRLVVSLLGSYDTPSYAPDGSRAFDLLARCVTDVEVPASARAVDVLVTFTPDPASFSASCTVEARTS